MSVPTTGTALLLIDASNDLDLESSEALVAEAELMAVFFSILIGVAHYIGCGDTAGLGHAALHAITAYGVAIVSSGVMLGILGVLKPRD